MTELEIKQIIKDTVNEIMIHNHDKFCRFNTTDVKEHGKQHESLARFLLTMEAVNKVKWSILKTVLTYLIMGCIALFGLGVIKWLSAVLGIVLPIADK